MPTNSFSQYRFTHLGMDVHRDSISVAILPPHLETGEIDRISSDPESVRRLIGRLGDPRDLRACYEAGPTGYGLHRQLTAMGVACEVIAPALIPKAPADRVKTDKRDARRLARLHRMGELVAIRVPTEAEEGVRDLLRAREDLIADRRRSRQRLSGMLLRHGEVFRGGNTWNAKHHEWLTTRRFADAAVQATYDRYRAVVSVRDAEVDAVEADLEPWFEHELFHDRCSRLASYRGIDRLGALTLVAEVCDWRRFSSAHHHMSLSFAFLPRPSSSMRAPLARWMSATPVRHRDQKSSLGAYGCAYWREISRTFASWVPGRATQKSQNRLIEMGGIALVIFMFVPSDISPVGS